MIINPSLPHGFVIFCDDVREEVSGKTTIVGAYGQDLVFQSAAPATLSQIAVSTWYRLSPDRMPTAVEFRLVYETEAGEESILNSMTFDLDQSMFPQMPQQSQSDPNSTPFWELRHVSRHEHVTFLQPGRLKCRVHFDGNEVRIGTLKVSFLESATTH